MFGIISRRKRTTGYSEDGIAPALGVPWRYPGRDKAKRRKALQRLHLRDLGSLLKRAENQQ